MVGMLLAKTIGHQRWQEALACIGKQSFSAMSGNSNGGIRMKQQYAWAQGWALTGLVCTLGSLGCDAGFDEEVGMVDSEIAVGSEDLSGPMANAVVLINSGGCTGTLVAPNIVLTAAHCGYLNEVGVSNDGGWYPLSSPRTIAFGPDRSAPLFSTTATAISGPSRNGPSSVRPITDIVLLRLQRSVPSTVAIPRSIMYERPTDILSARIAQVGYGGGRDRRSLVGDSYRDWTSSDPELEHAEFRYDPFVRGPGIGTRDTNIENGDSGGPMLYKTSLGPVLGVLSHWKPTGIATFAPTGPGKPSVRDWLVSRLPSPKPDLLEVHHNTWCSGDRPVVNIHLENHGVADAAPTYVDFFIGRSAAPSMGEYGDQWERTPTMSPLMHRFFAFTLEPARSGGTHWIDVIVDTDESVDESNESNNIRSFQVTLPTCS